MAKLITGFLLGVITTLAVVFWLNTSSEAPPTTADQPSHADSITTSPPSESVIGANAPTQEMFDRPSDSTSTGPTVMDEPSTLQPDAHPTTPAQPPSTKTNNSAYPPEIADMIEHSVDKDLQARYENDPREESWATYMEGLLAAYFAQKPALAQFYFSLIDCRTSVCEIHALGYGVEALTQWNTATADMVSQPWFEFNNMSMNRRNPEPDILAIVLILTKKPPD